MFFFHFCKICTNIRQKGNKNKTNVCIFKCSTTKTITHQGKNIKNYVCRTGCISNLALVRLRFIPLLMLPVFLYIFLFLHMCVSVRACVSFI